jgi:hypothetical protein
MHVRLQYRKEGKKDWRVYSIGLTGDRKDCVKLYKSERACIHFINRKGGQYVSNADV